MISVVTTYCPLDIEETKLLSKCLDSLTRTDQPVQIIVETAVNQSYAKTLNKGLAKAEGDYIIISNNDIIAPWHYAERLIDTLKETGAAAVCATESDTATIDTRGEINEITRGFFGSFWAMPRSTYDEFGGYDEQYEPYLFEDTDYWMTLLQAEKTIVQDGRVKVWHKKASSTTKHAKGEYQKIYDKNRERFFKKWGEDAVKLFH